MQQTPSPLRIDASSSSSSSISQPFVRRYHEKPERTYFFQKKQPQVVPIPPKDRKIYPIGPKILPPSESSANISSILTEPGSMYPEINSIPPLSPEDDI